MTFINNLNDYLWAIIVIPLLVVCALYFTIKTKGVQFSMLGHMVKLLAESPSSAGDGKDKKTISSFQAFVVSLTSRSGTGNLAGVASAIFVGGPGAVFWMWMMALLGSATAFVESTLAQLYKRKGEGSFIGGPAYYMKYGLHRPWLGVLFSIALALMMSLSQNIMQSNQISESIRSTFVVRMDVIALALSLLTGVIIFGGIHRIARFSSVILPIMAGGYVTMTLVIIGMNITEVPHVLKLIVTSAFGLDPMAGGAFGIAVSQGIKRGLFSNEAGEASTPNTAATTENSHPVKQGLIQALGVFSDTLLVCTCTALIILLSGVYQGFESDGILLTTKALETQIGPAAPYIVSVTIFLFAFTSILGNYYYGETSIRFITRKKYVLNIYRLITMAIVLLGGFLSIGEIWSLVDLSMAVIVMINIGSVLPLVPKVSALLKDYRQQLKEGKDPQFKASSMPEIEKDLEAW